MAYTHPDDNNLKNLHKVMEYDRYEQPVARVTAAGSGDYAGRQPTNGVFGDQVVGSRQQDIQVQFQYGISAYDVHNDVTGTGSNTSTLAVATMSSGASTGTASLQSHRSLLYQPGHDGVVMFTASFSVGDPGSYQRAGLFTTNDGYWVGQVDGTFTFGIRYNTSDTERTITKPSWLDTTKINIYRINYGWLGVAPVFLEVYGGIDRGWVTLDTYDISNTQNVPSTTQPTLPITMEVGRTSGSGAVTIETSSWCGAIIGERNPSVSNRTFHFPTVALVNGTAAAEGQVTLSGTNVMTAGIFHARTTLNGRANHVPARLSQYGFYVDTPASGKGVVQWQIIGSATFSGAPTYAYVNETNSMMEYDSTATTGASVTYASGGQVALSGTLYYDSAAGAPVDVNTQSVLNSERLGLLAHPDDTFTVLFKDLGGNNVTCRWSFLWEELF